jgi:hypothetical protein
MSKFDSFIWWAMAEAYSGNLESYGNSPGITRKPTKAELDRYFIAGGAPGYDKRYHWCGLYQVFLLKKAGVACRWQIGGGIEDASGGADLQIVSGAEAQKDLAFGDIVRVKHHEHHLMVLEPVEKGYIPGIEGNAGGRDNPKIAARWMANALHNVVEQIQFRYRVIS